MEYSIGEFSKLTGLGIHTLRYYEQEGLIAPERNSGNRRCYSDKDLTWIAFIKRLKDTGMPIKEIRHYAELRAAGDPTLSEPMQPCTFSPEPYTCASKIRMPEESPRIMLFMTSMGTYEFPTAARAFLPNTCPTTAVSKTL